MLDSQVKVKTKHPYVKIEIYINNDQQAEKQNEWSLEEDEWWDKEVEEELIDDENRKRREEPRIFIHPGYPVIRLKPRWSTSTK